jgi:hypothetical protein
MAFLGALAAVKSAASARFVKMQSFRLACADSEKAVQLPPEMYVAVSLWGGAWVLAAARARWASLFNTSGKPLCPGRDPLIGMVFPATCAP